MSTNVTDSPKEIVLTFLKPSHFFSFFLVIAKRRTTQNTDGYGIAVENAGIFYLVCRKGLGLF